MQIQCEFQTIQNAQNSRNVDEESDDELVIFQRGLTTSTEIPQTDSINVFFLPFFLFPLFSCFFVFPRDVFEVQSEKTKRKSRENNENLVPKPFTSTMIKSTKHQNSKMNWQPKSNDECSVYERYETRVLEDLLKKPDHQSTMSGDTV